MVLGLRPAPEISQTLLSEDMERCSMYACLGAWRPPAPVNLYPYSLVTVWSQSGHSLVYSLVTVWSSKNCMFLHLT